MQHEPKKTVCELTGHDWKDLTRDDLPDLQAGRLSGSTKETGNEWVDVPRQARSS